MLKINIYFLLLLCAFLMPWDSLAQSWSKDQLLKANTAKDISFLQENEKEAIMYINLARMYPKEFLKIEFEKTLDKYMDKTDYELSLIEELNTRAPVNALVFDPKLYEFAKCFSKESGDLGIVGHERKNCKDNDDAPQSGECCAYGVETGISICLIWLVDEGVSSLGHRKNCLSPGFEKIGLSFYGKHPQYGNVTVADFE